MQHATITGPTLRDVRSILDASYLLHRDPALAEAAIRKLESRTKNCRKCSRMCLSVLSGNREKRNEIKWLGGLGFEPRLTESESALLPFDDPPTLPM
jgi:hypothetical protein